MQPSPAPPVASLRSAPSALCVLHKFFEHRGATLARDELLSGVWGYEAIPATRTVDVHVAGLRRKLEPNPRNPQFILTLHGLG